MRLVPIACALLCLACGAAWAQDNAPANAAGILILGDSNSEGPFGGLLYETLSRGIRIHVRGRFM